MVKDGQRLLRILGFIVITAGIGVEKRRSRSQWYQAKTGSTLLEKLVGRVGVEDDGGGRLEERTPGLAILPRLPAAVPPFAIPGLLLSGSRVSFGWR